MHLKLARDVTFNFDDVDEDENEDDDKDELNEIQSSISQEVLMEMNSSVKGVRKHMELLIHSLWNMELLIILEL